MELQSASVHVSSTDTEDWELVTKSKVEPASRVKTESKQSKTTKSAKTPTTEPSTSRSSVSQPQPSTSQAKPPAAKKAQPVARQKPVRDPEVEAVRQGGWLVRELKGHEDLVLDCHLDLGLGLAATASRDTTVKVRTIHLSSWHYEAPSWTLHWWHNVPHSLVAAFGMEISDPLKR